MKLSNYLKGEWSQASGDGEPLLDPVRGAEDPGVMETLALELAPSHGRVHAVSSEVAGVQTGHGNVMPMSLHGGPGRAGGGQELGGLRALRFYHHFTALQGPARSLESLAQRATDLRPR